MTKKIKTLLSSTSSETLPEITLEMIQKTDGNEGIMENTTGETDQTPPMEEIKTLISISPKGQKFTFRDPSQMGPISYDTPTSKRMDELMILKLQDGYRTSGDHPNLKKTPKWMINPKFNGKERWMDLTKIHSFNLEHGLIILSRSEIQHRGMEGFIEGPFIQIETE
ncbi:hypothetical protein EVC30_077 [Rhizobium phage RHph_Y1_11]|nr:hypothetical protein EVC30_077 [Rhizobium phage RHph_Y1_11]